MARIVVYEDSPTIVTLVQSLLKRVGHEVYATLDVDDILRRLAANEVDLLILDVMVPEVSGVDLLTRYLASNPERRVPAIFLTAEGSAKTRDQIKALGAVDYIEKPFSPLALAERVAAALAIRAGG